MKSRSLLTLAVLAALVVAAAAFLSLSRHERAHESPSLYPQLAKELDKTSAIRLYGAGNQRKVELRRVDGEWRVSERFNYPASPEKVRQLLLDLGEAKTIEEKTSNAVNYPALGVEDVTAEGAAGTRVELAGVQGIALILGKEGPAMNARYVRKSGERQSWLVDRALDAPAEPKEWLKTQLLDVAAERIRSARIEVEGKQSYTVAKAKREDANFTVTDLKKGQALNTESAANSVGTALAGLHLVDVSPITPWQKKPPQARATYTTFDGLSLQLTGWVEGSAHWLAVRAQFAEPAAQGTDKKDKQAADPKSEASTLDARLATWAFQIPDYKYNAIFTPVEDMLKR
jgi:hypothetical protein